MRAPLFVVSAATVLLLAASAAHSQRYNSAPVTNPALWRYLPDPERAPPAPIFPERFGYLSDRELRAAVAVLRDRERQLEADKESLAAEINQRGLQPPNLEDSTAPDE